MDRFAEELQAHFKKAGYDCFSDSQIKSLQELMCDAANNFVSNTIIDLYETYSNDLQHLNNISEKLEKIRKDLQILKTDSECILKNMMDLKKKAKK